MKDVLAQQNKLPKDVLQQGLRPILVNLADAKRLSVSGLDGLSRFLELLNNYFKVEIGTKLLDHFVTLADPQMLAKAAQSPIEDNTDISRMSRLINVFRLLPSTGVQYLKPLTAHVVDAEAALQQSAPGPFTENIARYLDRYHVEGAANLIDNIHNPRYVQTYRDIIASGHAPQLVNSISARVDEICHICLGDLEAFDTVILGLHLLRTLADTSPSWLSERDSVVASMVTIWRGILHASRTRQSVDLSESHWQEIPVLILGMFMTTLRNKRHTALLFHVVEIYEIRTSFDKSVANFFLYEQVALIDSLEYRQECLEHFMTLYENRDISWAFKVNALRLIVVPTLRVYYVQPNDDSLLSTSLVHKLTASLWKPYASTAEARKRDDTLLIEIMALTTVVVVDCPKIADWRKDAFRVAWMGINLLEPTVKLMAYVLTSRFIDKFETPAKFTRLCWIGLLRLKESEGRALYRQAVNNIAGCLSIRDPVPTQGVPEWAVRLRTTLVEEGQSASQLVTVCEVLVAHPDLFYEYRELYVPQVAQSFHRLAFAPAATSEMKRLTVDAMELMFRWERRRMAARDEAREEAVEAVSPSPLKRQRLDRAGTAASSTSGGGWAAPGPVRELMTANLMKLISTSTDPVGRGGLTKRALDLFKEIIGPKGMPNVNVKLSFFQRTMSLVSRLVSLLVRAYLVGHKREQHQRRR
jgi:transformation/transcription domain-associated protein